MSNQIKKSIEPKSVVPIVAFMQKGISPASISRLMIPRAFSISMRQLLSIGRCTTASYPRPSMCALFSIEKCEIEKRGIQGPRTEKPGDDEAKKSGTGADGRPSRVSSLWRGVRR